MGPPALSRASLGRDLLAGLTVGLVLIPQALAYLQTGPVALTSLLTFGALAGHAPVGSGEYWQLGMLLALVVGVVRVAVGLLKGGVIAHLMSEPMLMGFVPAARC